MQLPSLAQREAFFVEELNRRGYSAPQKAAILGSIMQESSLNPYAQEKGGTGLGLFQWSYDRRKQVPGFTGDFYADARKQLDLFERELGGPEQKAGTMLKGAQTLDQAAAAMKQFERYGVAGNRYKYMNEYLSKLQGGTLRGQQQPSITSPAAQLAAGSLRDSFLQDPGAISVVERSAPKAFDIGSIAAGGLTGGFSSGSTDRLAGAVAAAVLGGTTVRKPIDTSDLADGLISDPATGLPQNTLPSVGAAAGASQARSPGAGGGAWTSRKRDPDAEATGWDVVLSGGRGAAIPAPVPIRITGTGFQGQGAGEGGRGYGNWVSGMFEKNGKQYELFMGHLDRIDVKPGMTLPMGASIGAQGESGRAYGAHVTTHVNPKAGASVGDAWNALDYVTRQWERGFG